MRREGAGEDGDEVRLAGGGSIRVLDCFHNLIRQASEKYCALKITY
jgi:hypothetical protein